MMKGIGDVAYNFYQHQANIGIRANRRWQASDELPAETCHVGYRFGHFLDWLGHRRADTVGQIRKLKFELRGGNSRGVEGTSIMGSHGALLHLWNKHGNGQHNQAESQSEQPR